MLLTPSGRCTASQACTESLCASVGDWGSRCLRKLARAWSGGPAAHALPLLVSAARCGTLDGCGFVPSPVAASYARPPRPTVLGRCREMASASTSTELVFGTGQKVPCTLKPCRALADDVAVVLKDPMDVFGFWYTSRLLSQPCLRLAALSLCFMLAGRMCGGRRGRGLGAAAHGFARPNPFRVLRRLHSARGGALHTGARFPFLQDQCQGICACPLSQRAACYGRR